MSEALIRGLAQGGPSLMLLGLVLWGGYKAAVKVWDRVTIAFDAVVKTQQEIRDTLIAIKVHVDESAMRYRQLPCVREQTGRHRLAAVDPDDGGPQ